MNWIRYRDIIFYRAYAELKSEADLNYMGYVWWFLEPLLNTVVFNLILVTVLEKSSADTVAITLVGSVTWQWTYSSIANSSCSIFDAGGMLRQIYLPKMILPAIVQVVTTWKFLFLFMLLLAWLWCGGHTPGASYFALPFLMGLQLILNFALSFPIAAIIPYFPDARITIEAILRSLMLVSGVFFPMEQLPKTYQFYYQMNPIADVIQAYRCILLKAQWPDAGPFAYVLAFSLLMLVASSLFYQRIDRSIVKAIQR